MLTIKNLRKAVELMEELGIEEVFGVDYHFKDKMTATVSVESKDWHRIGDLLKHKREEPGTGCTHRKGMYKGIEITTCDLAGKGVA